MANDPLNIYIDTERRTFQQEGVLTLGISTEVTFTGNYGTNPALMVFTYDKDSKVLTPIAVTEKSSGKNYLRLTSQTAKDAFAGHEKIGEKLPFVGWVIDCDVVTVHTEGDVSTISVADSAQAVAEGLVLITWSPITVDQAQLFWGESRGLSAYELAVKYGYKGTEEEWSNLYSTRENLRDGLYATAEEKRNEAFSTIEQLRTAQYEALQGLAKGAIANITKYPEAWNAATTAAAIIDSKQDKDYSRMFLNENTCVGAYITSSGEIKSQSGRTGLVSDYIPVNGKNIVTNAKCWTGNLIIVYDSTKTKLRVLKTQKYTYEEGDSYIRVAFTIAKNEQWATPPRAFYGDEYFNDEYTEDNTKDIHTRELFILNSEDISNKVVYTNGQYIVHFSGSTSNDGSMRYATLDVTGMKKILVTLLCGKDFSRVGAAWYGVDGSYLSGVTKYGGYANGRDEFLLDVPDGAKTFKFSCSKDSDPIVRIKGDRLGKDEAGIASNKSEIELLKEENTALLDLLIDIDNNNQLRDNTSTLMVNLLNCVPYSLSTNGTVAVITPTATSAKYLEFSSSDIGKFQDVMPLVLRFSNGDCKTYWMKKNGIRLDLDVSTVDYESVDLTGVNGVESLHNTYEGGNGQHLSCLGYKALAQFVADNIKRKICMRDGVCVSKLNPFELKRSEVHYSDKNIYFTDGRIAFQPILHNYDDSTMASGGSASHAINADNDLVVGWMGPWAGGYRFVQDRLNSSVEIPFDNKVKTEGYIAIRASSPNFFSQSGGVFISDGKVKLEVFAEGELVFEKILPEVQQEYIIDNMFCRKYSVKLTLLEAKRSVGVIYSVAYYKAYDNNNLDQVFSGKKIACLGDSWMAFPEPTEGDAILPNDPFNTKYIYEDGTKPELGGYGYFPKELARVTGAYVANWGIGGTTTQSHGLVDIDHILAYDRYDFLVIEFFVNDYNSASISKEQWRDNLKTIVMKCKKAGVRPIVLMPCATDSAVQAYKLGEWNVFIENGL